MSVLTTSRVSFPKLLASIALAALIIRVGAAWNARALWETDRDLYLSIARQILAGQGFSRPLLWVKSPGVAGESASEVVEWWLVPEPGAIPVCRLQAPAGEWNPDPGPTAHPTAYRPPLYPCLVALMMWLTGGVWGVILGQVAGGILTVVLVTLAARRNGLGEFSLVAGLIVALDPLLVSYTPQVMTETTAAGLVGFLIWSTSVSPEPWRPLVGGLCLGLCALCRPTFLASGLVWGLLWWLSARRVERGSGIRPLLIVPCGMALMVAPWAIRNLSVLGDWIPSTTHGGYTLRLAHNPQYDAWLAADLRVPYDGEEFARYAAPQVGIDVLEHIEREVDNAHAKAAWKHIWEHPSETWNSACSLWKRFWGPIPDSRREAPIWLRLVLTIHWLLVGISAMAGLWRLSGEPRSSVFSLSLALLGSFTAAHSLYWADARMRAPLIPVLALLSASGFRWLVGRGLPSGINDQSPLLGESNRNKVVPSAIPTDVGLPPILPGQSDGGKVAE
jgi:4-amino-4-deoxy-L-arabinose transferase-like glycosyltransferase